jgi:regulator of PEP synthase PpsR (kinase-PPPase family)
MGAPRRRYADLEAVFEELETASRVHRRLRCPVIDVSDLSVEETAIRVVKLVANRSAERKARRG